MKKINYTINLVNPNKSDIPYKISKFPDGQQQVVIISYKTDQKFEKKAKHLSGLNIQIKARLNNFEDLELICCATASLRELGVNDIHLYTPYFLGGRSDRKFEENSNNYLKTVICPIINSLGFAKVTVLDPHSDVLEACLNNFNKIDNIELVEFAIKSILKTNTDLPSHYNKFNLVSPDAGALKKIHYVAGSIGYKSDIVICSKHRDVYGKLTRTEVPIINYDKDYIIIDDIADGAGTFINIAKVIKDKHLGTGFTPKLYLIVTHSIFSKGTDELLKYFDGVYCTNSYRDINNDLIKQLNIF